MAADSHRGRVRPNPEVLLQKLPEGDLVLLHMGTELYFSLDVVGARMWEVLTDTGDIDLAIAQLVSEFEVDQGQLLSDLNDLVGQLVEARLLEVVAAESDS